MSDWKVGDLALCLSDGMATSCRRGRVYIVRNVGPVLEFKQGVDQGIALEGVVHRMAHLFWGEDWVGQSKFRKITPGYDIKGIEEPRRLPAKEDA